MSSALVSCVVDPKSLLDQDTHIDGALLHRASDAQGVQPCNGCGLTACQLFILSLTLLSIAHCRRLKQGVVTFVTSVALLQEVDK